MTPELPEGVRAVTVDVEVLGHLIYYLPAESRNGATARTTVPTGTAVGHLAELLNIPRHEMQAILVNGVSVTDPAASLGPADHVVILPIISGG